VPDEDTTTQTAPSRKKVDPDLTARIKELELAAQREREERETLQRQEVAALETRLATEQVDRARAQARVQYPSADQELVNEYPTQDPEAILAYAAKLHERASMRLSANGVPMPPSNQTDAALSGEQAQINRWRTQIRNNHLRRTMDPIEAEQAWNTFFTNAWNSHMEARKRLSGSFYTPQPSSGQP
jgi:hypothetical protein